MKLLSDKKRLNATMVLAKVAHSKQKDKVKEPYFNHLDRVALSCKSVSAKIVAYLHDIIEDGHLTHGQLWRTGLLYSYEMDAVLILTKGYNGGSYEYGRFWEIKGGDMDEIKANELAREVKIADLIDNLDSTRFLRVGEIIGNADIERFRKYERSLAFLRREI